MVSSHNRYSPVGTAPEPAKFHKELYLHLKKKKKSMKLN